MERVAKVDVIASVKLGATSGEWFLSVFCNKEQGLSWSDGMAGLKKKTNRFRYNTSLTGGTQGDRMLGKLQGL